MLLKIFCNSTHDGDGGLHISYHLFFKVKRSTIMKKRLWLITLMLSSVLVLLSGSVLADPVPVARIGATEYVTLDEAMTNAEEGATIEILADCTTLGFNLSKTLTIKGAEGLSKLPTITFEEYGIALWGKSLTFKNCNVVMNGIGSTPYTAEWNWMSICASINASLTLDHVTMTMDATGVANSPHAIYFCNNNQLNLTNGSVLSISNYPNDALEWDGGNGGYNVNITDSTFISDHNRSGFTGTFIASFNNSNVQVLNSRGNGSNGTHFYITNSTVTFDDNGSHGLSAGDLVIHNSVVSASGNSYRGISVQGKFEVDGTSNVIATHNSSGGDYAGLKLTSGVIGTVKTGAVVTITDNYCSGLSNNGRVAFEEGVILTVTGNNNDKGTTSNGGGIYNTGANAQLVLPSDAMICNNHADTAGDDIYSTGIITFGSVGSDWVLDDCNDAIDGWYQDGAGSRWSVHAETVHAVEYTPTEEAVSSTLALKAAHGVAYTVTIHYLEKNTGLVLADAVMVSDVYSDTTLDLSEYLDKDIRGYRQVEVEVVTDNTAIDDGEMVMPSGDVVIHVYYQRNPIIPIIPEVPDDTIPNWLNLDDHYAYIIGYDDGFVKPQNNITRAEVATIFFRLLTDEAREYFWSTDSGFSDVKSSDWFNTAVSTMVNAGILTGYNDGTFRPNDPITRAEFATIAARFLSDPYSLQDRFYDTEGHWAEVYINRAAEVGWINGYNDGSFRPDKAITRAEAMTLVNAVLGREPHKDHLLPNMIIWPDNPKTAWYYEEIQEATNSHDYDWASSGTYEIWTALLENRQWAKLEKEWSNAYSAPGGEVMQ